MSDEIQTNDKSQEGGLIAYMFTNHPEQGPLLQSLLDMLYRGVYDNSIGIMTAYNKKLEKEELVLVGVMHEDGVTRTLPLARILIGSEGAETYLGPDGEGGWLGEDETKEEAEEV